MSHGKNQDNLKNNPYAALAHNYTVPAAQADVADRVAFIRRTYLHLAGAIGLFIFLETIIFTLFNDQIMTSILPKVTGWSWLVVLGAFMGTSWLADRWANNETSQTKQYMGLGLYVLAQVVIFIPILAIAQNYYEGSIATAGVVTAIVFGGLTATVFISKADFSFLRIFLVVGGLAAMATIVVGTLMSLPIFGIIFSGLMILFAVGSVLYSTSNVLHHYRTDQYVGAALSLFASVALLFWYILRFVMIMYKD